MPAIESLGPFEQLILTAVEALKASAYGPQVYEAACEFTGNAALLNCTKTQRRMHKSYFKTRRREWKLIQKEELEGEEGRT